MSGTNQQSSSKRIKVLEPSERLKILSQSSNAFAVDPNIPPKRYYRSGVEMIRMAEVYYKEGQLENAYVLYLKFMTLFIEKIRKHPDHLTVPLTMKQMNSQQLRDVMPKAEKLKALLLEQYTKEYNLYKIIEEDEKREDVKSKKQPEPSLKPETPSAPTLNVLAQSVNIDSVVYPSLDNVTKPEPSVNTDQPLVPVVDRSQKPKCPGSAVQQLLRTVVIPTNVMSQFLMYAKHNTFNNIETCGVLSGTLEQNQLVITHMIIPRQKGTSDSCTTMNEEDIFDYQDQHGLITIGWIHTHPTQTAFLSSVDLHTHCPYQLLMPEAIAIVCAPKYNDTGIFILTPNHGLPFIANCRQSGFHPHPTDPPLFMPADHIKIEQSAQLQIKDFR